MAYTKLNWVNDQTKLNATNMNRLELGISENKEAITNLASTVTDLSSNLTSVASTANTAKSTADAAKAATESNSGLIAQKQATLVSGTNIKTINGESLIDLTNGTDISIKAAVETKYEELNGISLDDAKTQGVYKVTNATKNPEETSTNGILHVTKLTEAKVEQEWLSETNRAVRILEDTTGGNEFYVNGVLTAPKNGVVSLAADKVYTLKGALVGRVEIGSAAIAPVGTTKIILDGVTIKSENTSAISFMPESKKLYVELRSDSKNYLIVEDKVSTDISDIAALHSNNNMTITGTGYLAIKNTMGHAIKASELLIQGLTHIYCDAKHDAIHGGSTLKISGGTFYIKHANDAISSSEGADNLGAMFISGGKFIINECTESAFQGKSANGLKKIYGSTEIELNGPFGAEVFKGEAGAEIKIYENVKITAADGITVPALTEIKSEYGEPSVTFVPFGGDATEVKAEDNIYVLTQTNTAGVYSIRGNFTGYKIYTATSKVDVEVFGIYYESEEATDEDAFITYAVNGKRLKLKFNENTISYISKKAGSCIKSAKNLQIVGKGDVFISNETGYGIYAPGGDTILAGDGTRYITNSKYGVITSLLVLGEDPGDVEEYEAGAKTPSTSEDAIYILNNADYDVYAITRTNSSNAVQPGAIISTTYHTGSSILGRVIYKLETPNVNGELAELKGDITANTGITLATYTPKTSYEYSATIYVKQNEDLTATNIYTYTLTEDYDNNFPTLSNNTASVWTVYATPDNIYTEEEVNELFVPRAEYNKLLAMSPKTVTVNYAPEMTEKVSVLKYVSHTARDTEPVTAAAGSTFFSRDGDFGYASIDGEGQVNFEYKGTKLLNATIDSTAYSNFKSPYVTCADNIYRITKVTDNLNVIFSEIDEATLPAYEVTYNFVKPENYEGALPTVTVYRCEDAVLNSFAGKVLDLTSGTATEYTYSKETGYRDNSAASVGNAQINFNITGMPEGYTCDIGIDNTAIYKNFSKPYVDELPNYMKATKVGSDSIITITLRKLATPVAVTYNAGSYVFDIAPAAGEVGNPLTFSYYFMTDKSNPDPDLSFEECRDRLESITINGEPIDIATIITADITELSGKKATITIPGELVTGDIVITTKTVEE